MQLFEKLNVFSEVIPAFLSLIAYGFTKLSKVKNVLM